MKGLFRKARFLRQGRFCFAQVDRLEHALLDERVLEAVLFEITTERYSRLRKLVRGEKNAMLEYALKLRSTEAGGKWNGLRPLDVLGTVLFTSDEVPRVVRREVWYNVGSVAPLADHAVRHFQEEAEVYRDVRLGKFQADFLAYYPPAIFGAMPEMFAVACGCVKRRSLTERAENLLKAKVYGNFRYVLVPSYLLAAMLIEGWKKDGTWVPDLVPDALTAEGLGLMVVDEDGTEIVADLKDGIPIHPKRVARLHRAMEKSEPVWVDDEEEERKEEKAG